MCLCENATYAYLKLMMDVAHTCTIIIFAVYIVIGLYIIYIHQCIYSCVLVSLQSLIFKVQDIKGVGEGCYFI